MLKEAPLGKLVLLNFALDPLAHYAQIISNCNPVIS